ncbi:MAG: hypothetical protein BKP49_01360 [Treponema sp. CETP13]|nr:MAG: hypothetical protein BKP49_01360 [Treponema sp. CETP13]
MFDNLLYQDVSNLLAKDFVSHKLPQAVLLSGPQSSGKLTCALELARIVSCHSKDENKGNWSCSCLSCLKHKALISSDLLLTGARDCTLEISAAAQTLMQAANSGEHLVSARYLFVRSVRKLTVRFNPILIEGDAKASKIEPLIVSISELLEEIELPGELPKIEKLEKIVKKINEKAKDLESGFMYDSLPVAQIRKASIWARYTVSEGKKVLIIENIDRMQEGVRNALLKILEEPPTDTLFILTTTRRSAVMPTILSRVRTYSFKERAVNQQIEVIQRVFHGIVPPIEKKNTKTVIQQYLNSFLPVSQERITSIANSFVETLHNKRMPDIDKIVKEMKNFEPRVMLKMFFNEILFSHEQSLRAITDAQKNSEWQEVGVKLVHTLRQSYSDVLTFNQSPVSALEQVVFVFLEEGLL